MAFGFLYPRYKERRTYKLAHDELFAAVQSALIDLHWGYATLWGKDFVARVPTTNWSWHHDFKVTFPNAGVIEAESKSAYYEIIYDLGRNKHNVKRFFACVEQLIDKTRGSSSA